MIRQPQHDYDDGSPVDAREEIAALIGAITVTPSSLSFEQWMRSAGRRHHANDPFSQRYNRP